jgi:hypothetical protein
MPQDVLAEIQNHLADYVVGIIVPAEGGGSRALGSGVLVSIEGRRGLLTCGHVAQQYENLPHVGLAQFIAGKTQRRLAPISDAQKSSYVAITLGRIPTSIWRSLTSRQTLPAPSALRAAFSASRRIANELMVGNRRTARAST